MSIKRELMIELKKIYDDKDFVCSTIDIAKSENAWNTLLDYIRTAHENGDIVTSDDIQLIAIHLRNEEEKKCKNRVRKRVEAAVL